MTAMMLCPVTASSKQYGFRLASRYRFKISRPIATSPWADFSMAPPDPIIGLNEAFQRDDFPQKVIVGVGAYRDDGGKPYVLPCVKEAEKRLLDQNLVSRILLSPCRVVVIILFFSLTVSAFLGILQR